MRAHKILNLLAVVMLLAGMLPGVARLQPAQAAAETPVLAQIDPALLIELEQKGTAGFFVVMAAQADLSAASEMRDWSERGWYVYDRLLETARTSQAEVIAYAEKKGLEYRSFYSVNTVYFPDGTGQMVQDLAAFEGVEYLRLEGRATIQPDVLAPAYGPAYVGPASPDTYYWNMGTLAPAASGGLYGMQAAQVWSDYGVRGEGIVVANIDTGVLYTHEALVRQYRGNNGDGTYDHDFNWYMPTSGCGDGTYPCDNHSHGTLTMGVMVGENATQTEQIGAAPGATWIACKGCEGQSCTDPALLGCGDWMLAPCPIGVAPGSPSCSPDMRPDIINNSWGDVGGSSWYRTLIQSWVQAGMFPAFSAGNDGACVSLGSPGDNPEAFGTAAHFSAGLNVYAGGPSSFYPTPSCDPNLHQIDPHISSPSEVRSSSNNGGYALINGTSGASPHTAGAVALIWSANPTYRGIISDTFTVLEQTANHAYFPPLNAYPVPVNCGKPTCAGEANYPNYDYGWGYLDALAAVAYVGVLNAGVLDGYVYDTQSMMPIEGASVMAAQALRGSAHLDADTGPTGYYSMTLPAGTYTVTASAIGYFPQIISGIVVSTGVTTTFNASLELAEAWRPGPSPAPFEYYRFDGVWDPHTLLIYFPGGRSGTMPSPDIWSYNPIADVWTDTNCNMLQNSANYTALLIEDDGTGRGEAIYLVGGYNQATATNISAVQRYYPSQPGCVVEVVETDPYPDNYLGNVLGAGGMAAVNGKIYVFGGWISSPTYFSNKVWEYDPLRADGERWEQVTTATLNPARAYSNVAVYNNLIYVMGGDYQYITTPSADLVPTDVVEVFDTLNPGAGMIPVDPMPIATSQGRGFGFPADTLAGVRQPWTGRIVVAGGGNWPDRSVEVMEYDTLNRSWGINGTWSTEFPDLINARRNHAGVFVDYCTSDPTDGLPGMWVFGGYAGADTPPYAPPEYYALPCNVEVPEVQWDKEVWVNGALVNQAWPMAEPIPVQANDEVVVVDRVWVTYSLGVTMTMSDQWAEMLSLVDYEVNQGTVMTGTHNLVWYGAGMPGSTWLVLTKTLTVNWGAFGTGEILEMLDVEGAAEIDDREVLLAYLSPHIEVAPLSLAVAMNPDDTLERQLAVANTGDADLHYELAELVGVPWLSEVPTGTVTVLPGEDSAVTLTFDTAGMAEGVYTETVIVDHNDPFQVAIAVEVVLTVTEVCVPVLGGDFTWSPPDPQVGEEVEFSASVTGGTEPIAFQWDLGDGIYAAGAQVSHTYLNPDTYTVVLTATNDCGEVVVTYAVVVTGEPVPGADLTISKMAEPDPVYVGGELVYTIVVENYGPHTATLVVVEDALPPQVTFVDASAGCDENLGQVTCQLGDLAPGEVKSIEIIVLAPVVPGTITNHVEVTAMEIDPDELNNRFDLSTVVLPLHAIQLPMVLRN